MINESEKVDEDIARAKKLPMCEVCMKQSDGSKTMGQGARPVHLCGTCYDLWLASPESARTRACGRHGHELDAVFYTAVGDFVRRVQAEQLWARRSRP
jgi:hypothetical protein